MTLVPCKGRLLLCGETERGRHHISTPEKPVFQPFPNDFPSIRNSPALSGFHPSVNRHPDIDPDQKPENDAAWELLLKARKTEVSPFFARNVLRRIRLLESEEAAGWRALFTLPRLAFGTAAAAAVIALIVLTPMSSPNLSPIALETPSPVDPLETEESGFDMGDYQDEIEMIDYFDDLLAVQDVSALDDAALSELLF